MMSREQVIEGAVFQEAALFFYEAGQGRGESEERRGLSDCVQVASSYTGGATG
jgi:hypothetical protein